MLQLSHNGEWDLMPASNPGPSPSTTCLEVDRCTVLPLDRC